MMCLRSTAMRIDQDQVVWEELVRYRTIKQGDQITRIADDRDDPVVLILSVNGDTDPVEINRAIKRATDEQQA